MSPTRRSLLKTAALGGAASLVSCERATSLLTQEAGQRMPDALGVCDGPEIDPDFHLLSRAAFGPWPGDVPRLKETGRDAWIEEQLEPAGIDDSLCDLRAGGFESLMMEPGNAYEFNKDVLRDQITRHALLRAVYSRRQLFEVMVEFWTDHLNIDLEKGDCVYLKPADDREVVRRHALGKFRDLIMASAKSPAMLTYLDGRDNKVRRKTEDKPNENYARELMELHTLGVRGGYTQDDVREAARCLTGWTVDKKARLLETLNPFKPGLGQAYFRKDWHDEGEKKVLGQVVPAGGGERDIERLVDIVCAHPSTAPFIASKLCRRFVSYDAPESLVNRVAAEFTRTGGDIKSLLRVILRSDEFQASRGRLLKRPFRFVVSALRAIGADTHAHAPLMETLHRMGQGLFQHPTPDGYPDAESPWLGTLLWRWNFAFALAGGKTPAVNSDVRALAKALEPPASRRNKGGAPQDLTAKLVAHFTGRKPAPAELEAIGRCTDDVERVGLILASPAFQRC
jgi:uncharacterized protein (DUF1800 family)